MQPVQDQSLYILVPQCAQDMCIDLSDGTAKLQPISTGQAISDQNSYQRWVAEITQGAVAFYNAVTGRRLRLGASNASVEVAWPQQDWAYVPQELWNFAPAAGGQGYALQNVGDPDQNLNVAGDGPYPAGTAILCWSWSGGAPNEVWNALDVW
jgi:hypothetical protein